jgi:GT2 family glycosyltransferase
MQKELNLLIIILNWNSHVDTTRCIASIFPQLVEGQTILVVDNGSTDDSIRILQERFGGIDILANSKNLGFQGGMNSGIREAIRRNAKAVLLLNSDTIASPTMLADLTCLRLPDAAILSPGIYHAGDPEMLCSTGGKISPLFLEMMRQAKPQKSKTPMQLEFLPSHAWLVQTSVFLNAGLLDEMFFPLYYDDLDFCYRLKCLGYKLYLAPSVKIYHSVSLSMGGRNSPRERYLMARNSGYYFRKHMHAWQAPFIFLFRLGSAILWSLRLLINGTTPAVMQYWRGFWDGWFGKLPTSKTA